MSGAVRLSTTHDGAVARILFDRPEARNALTYAMYGELAQICRDLADQIGLRLVVLRGAGGRAFCSGTDIAELRRFDAAEDGLAYEAAMDAYLDLIARLPVPTLAAIDGLAVGGGLNISAACDLRVATPDAQFGAPIARMLGGCLSMRNFAGLAETFGVGRAKRMLMLGDLLSAEEALECGFLARIFPRDAFDAELEALIDTALANAPITQAVSKEAMARLQRRDRPDGEDLIAACYGSADFREGVAAFFEKRKPAWTGS